VHLSNRGTWVAVAGACLSVLLAGWLHGPVRRAIHAEAVAADPPPPVAAAVAAPPPADARPTDGAPIAPPEAAACGREPASDAGASPASSAASRRIDAALRSSSDPFARATAVLLDLGDIDPAERERQLARLALDSNDPRVYGLAFRTCRQHERNGCEALGARRWAELDPDNGVPWLYLLDEARARGDSSGIQEAMFRLAAARRFDEGFARSAGAIIASAAPGDLAATFDLAARALGMEAAQLVPYSGLSAICRPEAASDANLAQSCHAAAARMADSADTLLARHVGASVDFRVTGDIALRDRRQAGLDAVTARRSDPIATGCRGVRAQVRFLERVAALGEVEALRGELPASAAH
jgi:hypothetical protein